MSMTHDMTGLPASVLACCPEGTVSDQQLGNPGSMRGSSSRRRDVGERINGEAAQLGHRRGRAGIGRSDRRQRWREHARGGGPSANRQRLGQNQDPPTGGRWRDHPPARTPPGRSIRCSGCNWLQPPRRCRPTSSAASANVRRAVAMAEGGPQVRDPSVGGQRQLPCTRHPRAMPGQEIGAIDWRRFGPRPCRQPARLASLVRSLIAGPAPNRRTLAVWHCRRAASPDDGGR